MGGIHRQQGDFISLLLFFQNEESKLKIIAKKLHIFSYIRLTLTTFFVYN
jgi:hypothetical protein